MRKGQHHTPETRQLISDQTRLAMKRHDVREKMNESWTLDRRAAAATARTGDRNPWWVGNDANYRAFHKRVVAARGAPSLCEVCGTTMAPWFDWHCMTGHYEDVNDYQRVCRACHVNIDGRWVDK